VLGSPQRRQAISTENPYQPPVVTDEAPQPGSEDQPQGQPGPGYAYKPGGLAARAAVILLWISLGLGAASALAGLNYGNAYQQLQSAPTQEEASVLTLVTVAAFTLLVLLKFLARVVTGVFFCIWFHRAYKNVKLAFGVTGMRHSPGWAVGSFFVPFANLYIPLQCAQDFWVGSHPDVRSVNDDAALGVKSGLVALWWVLFLLMLLAGGIGGQMMDDLTPTFYAMLATVGADLATVAGALVAMRMIKRVEALQRDKHEELSGAVA